MSAAIGDALGRLLAASAGRNPDGSWSASGAQATFEELGREGWTRVGLSEALGGADGSQADVAAVITACTRSGHLLPIADLLLPTQTLLRLATLPWLSEWSHPVPVPGLATRDRDGALSISADRVPWARWASHLLVVSEDRGTSSGPACVSVVRAADAQLEPGGNLAGEPRDRVSLLRCQPVTSVLVQASAQRLLAQVRLAGALARSIQLSAAIERVLELTIRYCSDRQQFGRPLRQFQAVQQELAALAGESAAAASATARALAAQDRWAADDPSGLDGAAIAVAKARTSRAAGAAARVGHQLHGAMGITLEYPLHQFTTALWSWREEYGGESEWGGVVLRSLGPVNGDSAWAALTAGR